MAFQEFGARAPAKLGISWHVTPEADGHGGFGTKVEVVGQWMGSEAEYEVVMQDFEGLLRAKQVGEFQRGQRSLSESRSGPYHVAASDTSERICNPCTMWAETGQLCRRGDP